MNSRWIQRWQQKDILKNHYYLHVLQQRFQEDRLIVGRITHSSFGITAIAHLDLFGDELGTVSVMNNVGTQKSFILSCFAIENILPISSESALVILKDCSVIMINIREQNGNIEIRSKQIPLVDHAIGSLRYCLDKDNNVFYYISNKGMVCSVDIISLSVHSSSHPASAVSWMQHVGLLSIGPDKHSVFHNGNSFLFHTDYQIGSILATDDSRFVVTYGNGDGCIYLYDCTLPTMFFMISSTSINQSIPPCYLEITHSFVFAGLLSGELFIYHTEHLLPSSNLYAVICKESTRLRFEWGLISSFACLSDSTILVGDKNGSVFNVRIA